MTSVISFSSKIYNYIQNYRKNTKIHYKLFFSLSTKQIDIKK